VSVEKRKLKDGKCEGQVYEPNRKSLARTETELAKFKMRSGSERFPRDSPKIPFMRAPLSPEPSI
jgi:hypothetical protein